MTAVLPASSLPQPVLAAFGLAIEVAARQRGATAPNPPVGCAVLDRDGCVLAVEAHRRAGEPHAEALAPAQCDRLGTTARIVSMVVTLEPCNHWGRTPPCAEAILRTPARTVWIGMPDPDPHVAGGGTARMQGAGLVVHDLGIAAGGGGEGLPYNFEARDLLSIGSVDDVRRACRALLAPFAKHRLTGRPYVTVKQALDPSGSMIPPPGRKTFTSQSSLLLAHRLRRRADAVLTGSGTVLADDPGFDVRYLPDHPGKRRHLVILDRRGRVPVSYIEAAAARGFTVMVATDPVAALDALGKAGALEVLVEAGPSLTADLLGRGLWDEHVVIRKGRDGEPDRVETVYRDSLPPGGSGQAASARRDEVTEP